ncbi:hypothetical protein MTR_1g047300 [Medicago truncatula]|uniref:Uncharacterized protein n=1 Tax=Medicago truncatula TaxID=3880 RepID=A0A072VIH9_MEDTR|nr:hypothetical protein MTR_1g047300 [Medicago truncatula]
MRHWKKTNFGSSTGNQYYSASPSSSFGRNLTKEQLIIMMRFDNCDPDYLIQLGLIQPLDTHSNDNEEATQNQKGVYMKLKELIVADENQNLFWQNNVNDTSYANENWSKGKNENWSEGRNENWYERRNENWSDERK